MKFFFGRVLGFAILLSVANISLACSPDPDWPPSAEVNYNDNQVVFVGLVRNINQKKDSDDLEIGFKVIKTYKGDIDTNITIHTPASSSMCGYNPSTFKVGQIWIIYATDNLTTTNLDLNKKTKSIKEALKELDKISKLKKCKKGNNPVCAESETSTEETYSNICEMESAGAKFLRDGACEECSDELKPVCGVIETKVRCIKAPCPTNQKRTFQNKCFANRANAKSITNGKCSELISIPKGNPTVNIKENQIIKSPLDIKGNSNHVWFGFEGSLGTVELVGESGQSLAKSGLNIIGEWMTEKAVDFESKIEFNSKGEKQGKLIFRSENPSGEPNKEKSFTIPVKFEQATTEQNNSKKGFWEALLDILKKLLNF